MIDEMKAYFKNNDLKVKKLQENSEIYSEDVKKMKLVLQENEKYNFQTGEKVIKIKNDCESNY